MAAGGMASTASNCLSLFVTCRHAHQHAAILFCRPVVCSTQCRKANGKGSIIFSFDTCGKHLALWAIRAYQRHLSPWKGFRCAYRVLTGRDSCSAYGYKVALKRQQEEHRKKIRQRQASDS